jgi:hypothetical protein
MKSAALAYGWRSWGSPVQMNMHLKKVTQCVPATFGAGSDNLPNHAILDMLTLVRSSASWR